jgi:hypothetical protein
MKNFLMKQALKAQLKNLPEEQREQVLQIVEKNPKLFETIGKEIEQKTKAGMDKNLATLSVMRAHQKELQDLMK